METHTPAAAPVHSWATSEPAPEPSWSPSGGGDEHSN
jgi:hypothetical protein